MKILVGLGNPGKEYEDTRHNVGFMFLDFVMMVKNIDPRNFENAYDAKIIREFLNFNPRISKISEQVNDVTRTFSLHMSENQEKTLILYPQTFMNKSGEAVAKAQRMYKTDPGDIIVVHDDLDMELGNVKIELGHGPKAHNGLISLEQHLGTKDFWRVRIGVDRRRKEVPEITHTKMQDGYSYVLEKFQSEEKKQLEDEIFPGVGEQLFV